MPTTISFPALIWNWVDAPRLLPVLSKSSVPVPVCWMVVATPPSLRRPGARLKPFTLNVYVPPVPPKLVEAKRRPPVPVVASVVPAGMVKTPISASSVFCTSMVELSVSVTFCSTPLSM